MIPDRPYDVVVYGATGFTGRLAAEYLAQREGDFRWAIAGRNAEKLADVRAALLELNPECERVGVLEANADDPLSMAAMTAQTRVVITTVGPYNRYGEPLVKACVETATDYVDITGEPEFVDRMIERYHEAAKKAKIRVVSCCGFDSIPHDLGVLFTVGQLPPGEPIHVEGFVRATGSFSGGTWSSALDAMGNARKAKKQPATNGDGNGRRVGTTNEKVRYHKTVGAWVAPMPTIDGQIVRRSARALAEYGPDFRYGHYMRVKSLPLLVAGAAGVGTIFALAQFGPTRSLLRSFRKPGQGPDEATRAAARFTVTFVAEAAGKTVVTTVSGGDPGYGETSKMVSEAALCLVADRDKIGEHYGVITPAQAMGKTLIDRLQRSGIAFTVVHS